MTEPVMSAATAKLQAVLAKIDEQTDMSKSHTARDHLVMIVEVHNERLNDDDKSTIWEAIDYIDDLHADVTEAAAAALSAWQADNAEMVAALAAMTAIVKEFHAFCDDKYRPCGEYGAECPIGMGEWVAESERHQLALLAKHGRT